MIGTGHGLGTDATTEAVTAALGGRTPEPGDLVVVFPTFDQDPQAVLAAATAVAGAATVVGCSSFASFTGDGQVPSGCAAAYLPSGGVSFGVGTAEPLGSDISGATRRAAESARVRAGGGHPYSVLMILSDGLAGDQREVMRGAYAVAGATVPIVGGTAAEPLRMERTYQIAEGRVLNNGVVAVWIDSPTPIGVATAHGWRPSNGTMFVTRADGNVIRELDGRPAREAYLAMRGCDPRDVEGVSFAGLVMDRPLGLPNASGQFDIRHILGSTPEGGLTMFGYVSDYAVVQIMESSFEELIDAAARATTAALGQLDGPSRGALVFSCAARTALFGERSGAEAQAIRAALSGAPQAGLFTYGEFARVAGSSGFHNATVAVLAF
ncbi:FIST signal transduction protein [Actinoplanes couchii]|uniref:Histidine kinase n=1 Tax=Actinoplanes couchii TaxID=403638 RepID=A0ABQ3WZR6_9ACTN|nr:FIST N-terminal domain-containing protein [Actinoplanes couchii]GID51762.1 histidine kinase [Actinoplanes couchii]